MKYPALFNATDNKSIAIKRQYFRALSIYLVLLVLISVAYLFYNGTEWVSVIIAVMFGISLVFIILIANKHFDKKWYIYRAIAESVKTMTWRFIMKAEPYNSDFNNSKDQLLEDFQNMVKSNSDKLDKLPTEYIDQDQITASMVEIRNMSLHDRIDFYRSFRIEDQRNWYLEKSIVNQNKSKQWLFFVISLNVIALLLALSRIWFLKMQFYPVKIFAVGASVCLTWFQANRFSELSTSYSFAALEIGLIMEKSNNIDTEKEFSDFVGDVENAFSREHTTWAARRDVRNP